MKHSSSSSADRGGWKRRGLASQSRNLRFYDRLLYRTGEGGPKSVSGQIIEAFVQPCWSAVDVLDNYAEGLFHRRLLRRANTAASLKKSCNNAQTKSFHKLVVGALWCSKMLDHSTASWHYIVSRGVHPADCSPVRAIASKTAHTTLAFIVVPSSPP